MYKECNVGVTSTKTYAEVAAGLFDAKSEFYLNPVSQRIDSFQIFGNLYYVGDKKVCSHLIDTGDGLILFDTGYGHTLDMILESIRSLGFKPEDIKYIIHSHGHYDHFGSGDDLRRMYGCKVFMSEVDTELLRERPDRSLVQNSPVPGAQVCWPDAVIKDGEHIVLGNTDIHCVLTPGHTLGTMTFFFDVADGEQTLRAGYFGGAGFISIYKDHCKEFDLPLDMNQRLQKSIQKVWDAPVDIMLGNHPAQNCTVEKREWMLTHPGTNPFINPKAWNMFLEALLARSEDFERRGL